MGAFRFSSSTVWLVFGAFLAAPERSIPWWQSAAALWLHAEPAFGPQDRRLHHVGDICRWLRDQHTVHDRLRAELPCARIPQRNRWS